MEREGAEKDPGRAAELALAIAVLALVSAGVLARVWGLQTDFWLDEVWSYDLARSLHSPLEVLTRLHHSNNHHLNTLFLYLLGPDLPHWGWYRLLSLAAGIGSIALLARIAAERGRTEGWSAAVLGSCSYVLVFHSAEARGYALVVFFALLAYLQLGTLLAQPTWRRGAVFGLTVVLGFLSHLQFVHVYAAAFVWSVWRACRSTDSIGKRMSALLRMHSVALVLLAGLYWVDVRKLHVGGGPDYDVLQVLGSTASLLFGVPSVGWLPLAALAVAVGIAIVGIMHLARRGEDAWVFHLVVILISPAILLAVARPDVLFERYFILSHAFLLLLLAELLAEAWRSHAAWRAIAAACLLAMLIGNGVLIARFLRDGSGRYLEALEFIASEAPGPVARVASDNDGRTSLMVDFYQRWLPPGERIEYVRQEQWPDAIQWVLVHSLSGEPPRDTTLSVGSERFDLARRFPRGSHAGWDWYLFRRAEP
jgi:hypothetical protein